MGDQGLLMELEAEEVDVVFRKEKEKAHQFITFPELSGVFFGL